MCREGMAGASVKQCAGEQQNLEFRVYKARCQGCGGKKWEGKGKRGKVVGWEAIIQVTNGKNTN